MDTVNIQKIGEKLPSGCEMLRFGSNDCSYLYNCCDCGTGNCGCRYCFSCNACEYCLTREGND